MLQKMMLGTRWKRPLRFFSVAAAILLTTSLFGSDATAHDTTLTRAIKATFGQQQGAAVVVRVSDGKIIALHNPATLSRRLLTPGSTIKPFTLALLLEHKLLNGQERFACRRGLSISGVRLNCSHPDGLGPFNAEEALAFSCNSYFTEAAKRLPDGALEQYFRTLGFDRVSGMLHEEAEGHIRPARTVSQRQLLAIGTTGVEITPLELAAAYLQVARWRTAPTTSQRMVLNGLDAATTYGLAQEARPKALAVSGKTGTASDKGMSSTHAWFAGFAPSDHPQIVVVVYVERGRGSQEAASIARKIFESWAGARH